jgi:hypothetical protein
MVIAPQLQSGDCHFAVEQSASCNLVAPGIFAIAKPWIKHCQKLRSRVDWPKAKKLQ